MYKELITAYELPIHKQNRGTKVLRGLYFVCWLMNSVHYEFTGNHSLATIFWAMHVDINTNVSTSQ